MGEFNRTHCVVNNCGLMTGGRHRRTGQRGGLGRLGLFVWCFFHLMTSQLGRGHFQTILINQLTCAWYGVEQMYTDEKRLVYRSTCHGCLYWAPMKHCSRMWILWQVEETCEPVEEAWAHEWVLATNKSLYEGLRWCEVFTISAISELAFRNVRELNSLWVLKIQTFSDMSVFKRVSRGPVLPALCRHWMSKLSDLSRACVCCSFSSAIFGHSTKVAWVPQSHDFVVTLG